MGREREEAFETALDALRRGLLEGRFPPGDRIPVVAVADELKLSATPVREALSRLAGEGVVEERRHQGFFARRLTGGDVADLYRLSQSHLLMLLAQERAVRHTPPQAEALSADPVIALESFFLAWVDARGSPVLHAAYRSVATQLGPVRRTEARLLDELDEEALELARAFTDEAPAEIAQALRKYHGRRIAASDRLLQIYVRHASRL
ncbi:GntR family transcriptional regulator [Phenylobacterium sp. VNQ135]|uniref:GntR family transcriptional regulator n=1 Tax=Phenylobacterium sp. VNQ135 TaxID=3400922 RepID=UPI003C01FF02